MGRVKILQVVADGAPGGGTTHVLQILRGLRDRYDFSVLTDTNSYLAAEARNLEVPVFEAPFFQRRVNPRLIASVLHANSQFSPCCLHAHGGRAAFWLSIAGVNRPWLYTVHGFHFSEKGHFLKVLAKTAERLSLTKASRVVFVSEYDRALALRAGLMRRDKPNTVILNGVEFPETATPRPQNEIPVIGFVGRFVEQKDPLLFVEMMARLPDYRAVMIGSGPLEVRVREAVASKGLANIELRGGMSREAVLKTLEHLDLLVMTSRWEGLPIVLLEALIRGVPVVALSVGGIPEVVREEKSGVLVNSRDPCVLAQQVDALWKDQDRYRELRARSSVMAQTTFSVGRMLEALDQLYAKCAVREEDRI